MLPRHLPRRLVLLAPLLAAVPARADEFISAPDVVVYTEPSLKAALQNVGDDFRARTGVPVRLFASPGTLQLELLARGTRADIVVLQESQMDEAGQRGLLRRPPADRGWRDPLVLIGAPGRPTDPARFAASGARIAVIDPVARDRVDGPAIARRLGFAQDAIIGMPSGPYVLAVIAEGRADLGILYRSDVMPRDAFRILNAALPEAPDARYRAALNHNALSREAATFLDYLFSDEATADLRRSGLEATQ